MVTVSNVSNVLVNRVCRMDGNSSDESLIDPEVEMTLDHVSGNPEADVNRSRKRLKRPTIVILIDTPLNE